MTARQQVSQPATVAILLVDDDEAVRKVLGRTLERLGYGVVQAESGEQALSLIRGGGVPFDMVVCDTVLGGMNGHETARLIGEAQPGLPLIAMSGYPRDPVAPIEGGPPRFFIAKPFRAQDLALLIEQGRAHA